jgi:hypothetical protein
MVYGEGSMWQSSAGSSLNVPTNSTDVNKDRWNRDPGCTSCDTACFAEVFPFPQSSLRLFAVLLCDVALNEDIVAAAATAAATTTTITNMVMRRHYVPVETPSHGVFLLVKVFWCPDLHFNLLSVPQSLYQGLNSSFPV